MRIKIKSKIVFLFAILLAMQNLLNAQDCGTPTPTISILDEIPEQQRQAAFSSATFKVAIHLVRKNNGDIEDGAILESTALSALSNLQLAYSFYNICFSLKDISYINETEFLVIDGSSTSEFNALIETDVNNDAIDIYMVSSITNNILGIANDAPGRALVIGNDGLTTMSGSTFIHEMGHVLGLFHPHETDFGTEAIDGSNCATAGDKVCDTPATPETGYNNTSCIYTGGGGFNPPMNNYMMQASQSHCRTLFTQGQLERIMLTIPNAPVLSNRLVSADVNINGFNFPIPMFPNGNKYKFIAKNNISASYVTVANTTSLGLLAENQIQFGGECSMVLGSYLEAKTGVSCPAVFGFRYGNNSEHEGKNVEGNTNLNLNSLFSKPDNLSEILRQSEPRLMPNPGNGIYLIQFNNMNYTVSVYDMRGDLIKTQFISEQGQVDIAEFSNGLYTFIIKADNYSKAMKVVKTD